MVFPSIFSVHIFLIYLSTLCLICLKIIAFADTENEKHQMYRHNFETALTDDGFELELEDKAVCRYIPLLLLSNKEYGLHLILFQYSN